MNARNAVLLVLLAGSASAGEPDRGVRLQSALPALDKMYTELAEKEHLPGLIYGVVLDGKLVHTRSLGFADLERKVPVDATTAFRIASMTKSFVAMAALQLRDEGKLRLDDPVAEYLPELRRVRLPTADSPPITIRHLLTMTTGLPEDNPWGDRQMAQSNAALGRIIGQGLSFSTTPGQAFEYSNLGYVMLGKVVSKVARMRFQDYVTKKILLPLGMKNTLWEYSKVPKDKLALGYRWTGTGWEAEPILHDGDGAAMGGLITTMDDFARYTAFHLDAWPARDGAETGPLRRASVREMQMPQALSGFSPKAMLADGKAPNPRLSFYSYGLGWARDGRDVVHVGHSGGLPGFGSQFRFAPDHGIAVIAFTNLRYGPVYGPTSEALFTLVDSARLAPRPVAPSAILLERKKEVLEMIQSWEPGLSNRIVAENFFLDLPREEWMKNARAQFDKIGKVLSVGPIKPQNQLRGTFPVIGERGTLEVFFTLTPEKEPKVQQIHIMPAKP